MCALRRSQWSRATCPSSKPRATLSTPLNCAEPTFLSTPERPSRCCAPTRTQPWFHGRDGLGDHNYPAPKQAPQPRHAVDAIIETIEANPGLVLVTLGPLTNVALALSR